jgi:hypothetical protein
MELTEKQIENLFNALIKAYEKLYNVKITYELINKKGE